MIKPVLLAIFAFLLLLTNVYAQEDVVSNLYAVPFLGLFVTSMIVVIVWLVYKDKFEE